MIFFLLLIGYNANGNKDSTNMSRDFLANLLRVLDQQGTYEVFGNLGHVTEVFIVELVLACSDVRVSLLLVLAQER